MNFDEIMLIIADKTKTDRQKGADLEAAFGRSLDLFVNHFGVDPTAGDAQARSCAPQRCP